MEKNRIKIRIYRKDPEKDAKGYFQEFDVPVEEGMVVLDAVNYVTEHYDQTIAVRWNCKAARCGSCAAEINGMPKLMCKTRIDQLGGVVSIEPMHAFPLVKDLVTDVNENYETERAMPEFTPKEEKEPWIIDEMDVLRSQEFRKCIECFLCQDVCHVIRDHTTKYIGPRHVAKAASLDMHPADSLDRSKILTEEKGLGYCNVTKCCQEVCPEHIKITDNAIIPEKERAADGFYDPIMMLIGKIKKRKNGKNVE
ncbi:succinate dehydrogenase/fumarate reductase iron-sulfur subunit [Candidatus Marsarchaeota archaeon]|nr:succinate dehydrogenase/fumarate reductase iron-sulfur subunit [Candidatus Marsarchaeota archaeon]MCL5089906.1 succinate dehydrogenase/fumarate reductase iron-sulfur subunit [Candidatus Marsarchaeota archaeon]